MAYADSKSVAEHMDSVADYRAEESDAKGDVNVDINVDSVPDNTPPLSQLERDPNDPLVSYFHAFHVSAL